MTGQEYIQRQINLVKQQIKGSKLKIIVTDAVTKCQYDLYENELQTLESIENELKALEIIKKKPFASASCINYITINKNNSNMLDYNHYCMTIKDTLQEEEYDLLKEVLE